MAEIISTLYANNEVAAYEVDNGDRTYTVVTPNDLRKKYGLLPIENPKPIRMKLTGNSIIDKIHLEMEGKSCFNNTRNVR